MAFAGANECLSDIEIYDLQKSYYYTCQLNKVYVTTKINIFKSKPKDWTSD